VLTGQGWPVFTYEIIERVMAKKNTTTGQGCDCLEQVKALLSKENLAIKRHLQINFETGKGSLSPPSIVVEKIDGKKGKLRTVFCSHCPFCGKKYNR